MSLQEWVEIRSRELQTKEKEKGADKRQAAGTAGGLKGREGAEPRGEQQEATSWAWEREAEVEEMSKVDVSLVRKRRKLVKAAEMVPAKENVVAEEVRSSRNATEQRLCGPRGIPVGG